MKQKFLLFLVATLVLVSCGENNAAKTVGVRKVKCDTVQQVSSQSELLKFAGKLTSASEASLSFRIAGVIDKVNVKQGQKVRKGQILAQMDSRDYELQYKATEAEYDAIKAEAERVIALYEKNSTTQNNYDKAVSGLKRITVKKESHYNSLQDTKLIAPYDGYIQEVYFQANEAVSAGLPIVEIISSNTPEVEINIPVKQYRNLENLASASIALNDTLQVELQQIGVTHKANLNQLYTLRFKITTPIDKQLTPGMSVMVALNYDKSHSGELIIPFSSVVEHKGQTKVWVIEKNGKVRLNNVEIGDVLNSGWAVVESGVNAGDVVVTAGVNSLEEGQQVQPLEPISRTNIGGVL